MHILQSVAALPVGGESPEGADGSLMLLGYRCNDPRYVLTSSVFDAADSMIGGARDDAFEDERMRPPDDCGRRPAALLGRVPELLCCLPEKNQRR